MADHWDIGTNAAIRAGSNRLCGMGTVTKLTVRYVDVSWRGRVKRFVRRTGLESVYLGYSSYRISPWTEDDEREWRRLRLENELGGIITALQRAVERNIAEDDFGRFTVLSDLAKRWAAEDKTGAHGPHEHSPLEAKNP